MKEFNKILAQYGIFVKNGKQDIKDNKIMIFDAEIEEVNFQKLQEKDIKEICIFRSEIKYLYFSNKNTIKIDFRNCNFKNQIIARELYFENEVIFQQCIFDLVVDFSKTKFKCKIDFLTSTFKDEVRFIETQFQANQSNNETIENDFREVIFERRISFSNAIFQAKVNFTFSQFKDEVSFTKTKFQANQSNDKIIENHFLGAIFTGKATFDETIFQARVNFALSQFKDEVRFIGTQFLAKQSNNHKIIENEFREAIFKGKVTFDSLVFNKARINFLFSIFKDETLFLNINLNNFIFYNVEFNKTKFACQTPTSTTFCLFQNSIFKDVLIFEGIEFKRLRFINALFNGAVTFSNTKLNTKPQFINCTFSNQFNIEHKYIEYKFDEIEKIQEYDKLLNYRDLFRKLKSNRIVHHNLIDASELRAQELYTRELELKYKENKSLKEKIEQWQLFFYRKLCDHHTNLLLNLKWLVYIIALYVLFLGKIPIAYPACIIVLIVCMYCKKTKNIQLILSFIIIFITICFSPKLIFGVSNLFSDSLNWWQNLITAVYMVILSLILFSLQKTARKNSIMPN
ncbi:pentapeptide repeat-containing protein [Campylobacter volucris]|uniref:pentapeptide repeat-containing protein n=1 Tax=Campylobacter volucris TaxID=1031542 RepID=UPI00189F312F|nr:pentapeptide repeat-containing protein [Campylobacter volucris]MBF7043279.1 pentapeptide repeat-containing protein [Campylobacter volucris]